MTMWKECDHSTGTALLAIARAASHCHPAGPCGSIRHSEPPNLSLEKTELLFFQGENLPSMTSSLTLRTLWCPMVGLSLSWFFVLKWWFSYITLCFSCWHIRFSWGTAKLFILAMPLSWTQFWTEGTQAEKEFCESALDCSSSVTRMCVQ